LLIKEVISDNCFKNFVSRETKYFQRQSKE